MSSRTSLITAALSTAISLSAAAWSPTTQACGLEPFLGEICIVPYNFEPRNYAFTHGQIMSIAQNSALFALLGTTYGGNGIQTFALPDTRGRVIIGAGQSPGTSNYVLGQMGGAENVTLSVNQMPTHSHTATTTVAVKARGVSSDGSVDSPAGNTWAAKSRGALYSNAAPNVDMAAGAIEVSGVGTTIGASGGSQPFSIVQPYLVLNPIIALQGIFPSRN